MSKDRYAVLAASIIVVASLGAGFLMMDSPAVHRMKLLDQNRIRDLQEISRYINIYYQKTKNLPANYEAVMESLSLYRIPLDPESGDSYEYEITGDSSYRLCAEFSGEDSAAGFWSHVEGRQCFSFTTNP